MASTEKTTDHPRVCGEQATLDGGHGVRLGSPPRVRGTGGDTFMIQVDGRITPACAGNRCPPSWLNSLP